MSLNSPPIKEDDLQFQSSYYKTLQTHNRSHCQRISHTFSQKTQKNSQSNSMFSRNPTSRFTLFSLTLLLLLTSKISVSASEETEIHTENDDELEQLIAIDEQGEEEDQQQQHQEQQKEAEVLSKAQRIVIELNSDNAKRVINDNELVIILGYAPWCPRSAELMPQFSEAANKLKELASPVLIAKLDAERYPKVASFLDIKGFPTLLLFVNGSSQVYTGGFSAEDLVIWIRKKTGVPVIRISSVTEAEGFLKKYNTFVLGLFNKFEGYDHEVFVKAATSDDELQFVEVNDPVVAKVLFPDIKSRNFIGIVKSKPEIYTANEGTFLAEKILQFVSHYKFPLVTKLTELNAARVYSSPIKLQAMIFAKADNFGDLIGPLQNVARKFKSKIMFIYIYVADENLAKPFLTLFGLEDAKNTVVAAFDNRISSKYLLESDPTPSNIDEFALLRGSQPLYYKSQPIPEITVKSLLVSNVYVGEGSDFSGVPTKMLTVNGSLRMSIYNPATIFGIYVSSTPVNLIYSEIPVATGQLKKYYQPRKSRRTVSVIMEGDKVPLYGAGSNLTVSQTGIVIPLTLKFEIRSRGYVVGKLVKTRHKKQISCPVVIDSTSSKPIKFKKGTCTYD